MIRKMVISLLVMTVTLLLADEMAYNDDVTPKEAYEMVKKGALFIDVRSPQEFLYAGHAEGAINVPVFFVRVDMPPLKLRQKVAKMEFQKGRVTHPGKVYRPIMDENPKFVENVKKLAGGRLDRTIVVICRSGGRSAYAADKLAKNGFENVYNVEDGYIFGWRKAGLPGGGQ